MRKEIADKKQKTAILCILDGFGINPLGTSDTGNALLHAHTPCFEFMFSHLPWLALKASGPAVGLPEGQMGNSEVGHSIIGAGRVVLQDLLRMNEELADEDKIRENKEINKLIAYHRANKSSYCHIWGLFSDGGVHSHMRHMLNMVKFLKREGVRIALHLVTDGRDVAPRSVLQFLEAARIEIADFDSMIMSICGRYYAMDRDKRWERTELAAQALLAAESEVRINNIEEYIAQNYKAAIGDEFIKPAVIENYSGVAPEDTLLVINFRPDRLRQFLGSIINNFAHSFALTNCGAELDSRLGIIFPKQPLAGGLGEVIAHHGMTQLRLAETEKYAHVTFFFNGGSEKIYLAEERIMVPSPKIKSYDQLPAMSSIEITEHLMQALAQDKFNFICVNYANADMVGHSGNIEAARQACEALDSAMAALLNAIATHDGETQNEIDLFITADHGNVEQLFNPITQQSHTAHTTNLVPFIHVNSRFLQNYHLKSNENNNFSRSSTNNNFNPFITLENQFAGQFSAQNDDYPEFEQAAAKKINNYLNDIAKKQAAGSLRDIAPTILHCLGLPATEMMEGISLLDSLAKSSS